jgi:cell division protein ZapA
MSAHTVLVKILDKDYQVACPPEQEPSLIEAARYLDKQMRGVRDSGKVIGLERIAVMVALNTAYELLQKNTLRESQVAESAQAGLDDVKKLSDRIDDALQRFSQMEIG